MLGFGIWSRSAGSFFCPTLFKIQTWFTQKKTSYAVLQNNIGSNYLKRFSECYISYCVSEILTCTPARVLVMGALDEI